MTDQTIKDLFYGNLNLFDRPMHRSNEYNEALHEAGVAREVLEETMTDKQKDLLNAYVAIAKGLYKGRKPISHPDFNKIVSIWKNGDISAVEAMKRLGNMKPTTFYRKIKNFENK